LHFGEIALILPDRAPAKRVVAFLKTLTDGYTRTYADANTFTGACPK
jgi:hypothetical protein